MANPEIPVFKIKEKHVCYLTNSERESDLVNLQELPESLWLLSLNASSFTAQIRKKSESEIRENKVWNDLLIKARV